MNEYYEKHKKMNKLLNNIHSNSPNEKLELARYISTALNKSRIPDNLSFNENDPASEWQANLLISNLFKQIGNDQDVQRYDQLSQILHSGDVERFMREINKSKDIKNLTHLASTNFQTLVLLTKYLLDQLVRCFGVI